MRFIHFRIICVPTLQLSLPLLSFYSVRIFYSLYSRMLVSPLTINISLNIALYNSRDRYSHMYALITIQLRSKTNLSMFVIPVGIGYKHRYNF